MTVISLCDVMIRRRPSLPSPVVDPTSSLNEVELAEASPTTGSARNNRYTRKIRTTGTTRPAVDPTSSLKAVELAEASPHTRPAVDPTSSLIAVELAEASPHTRPVVDPVASLNAVESTEASPDTRITSRPGKVRGSRTGVTR